MVKKVLKPMAIIVAIIVLWKILGDPFSILQWAWDWTYWFFDHLSDFFVNNEGFREHMKPPQS